MRHTPGPWFVGSQNDGLCIINQPPSPSGTDVVWKGRDNVRHIACLDIIENSFAEASANADLISAAPDLLTAAKRLLELIDDSGLSDHSVVEKMRDVISRAEGTLKV